MSKKPVTPADINKANAEFWDKEKDKQRKLLKSKYSAEIIEAVMQEKGIIKDLKDVQRENEIIEAVNQRLSMERAIGLPVYFQTDIGSTIAEEYLKHMGSSFDDNRKKKGSTMPHTKYIHKLVSDNPDKSAKILYSMADKTIIGDMPLNTFSNVVTDGKKANNK